MLRMDQVHVIRYKHLVEGRSIRGIARELGLHRQTVEKYLHQSEPQRVELVARPQPVMGVVGPRIAALLKEWAPRIEGKHRLTAPRVHRQLIEEGLQVGERSVRKFMAEKRRQSAEVYIPLVHRPGDEAQVDFFEVLVDEDGRGAKPGSSCCGRCTRATTSCTSMTAATELVSSTGTYGHSLSLGP